jgi:hypothetical protein
VRLFQSKEEREKGREQRHIAEAAAVAVHANYEQLPERVRALPPADVEATAAALHASSASTALHDSERTKLVEAAIRRYADLALDDDVLSRDEESRFTALTSGLGISETELTQGSLADVFVRIAVGRLNDGRLSSFESTVIVAKRGEQVYAETEASLLKEVAVREWQSGSQGVSIRLTKGVRYYVGGTRGRMVTVGSQMQTDDAGSLVVTSTRAVFVGARKTLEFPLTKIVSVEVFSDGIRLHASNRVNAPLFKLRPHYGDVVAATLHAAIRNLDA